MARSITQDLVTARWSLETRIADPCAAALIVEDDSGMSGAVLVGYGREFCTERIGYVEKLYVHPRARGTRAGRVLASGADEWFRQHLCWVAFATATAGVGQDRRFVNLLAKVGFVEIGPTLQRDYANG